MSASSDIRLGILNAGSSSLKFSVYSVAANGAGPGGAFTVRRRGSVQGIGSPSARVVSTLPPGPAAAFGPDATAAMSAAITALAEGGDPACIAHRIVHPGMGAGRHGELSPELLAELAAAVEVDPTHLPLALAGISACQKRFPRARQVACFDTDFHRHMSGAARLLPLPRAWLARGLRRLGFHGISCGYLMEELERRSGAPVARGRVVLAHLGSGASMTAVRGGRSLDTSMGFTANSGLVMATRCGDLDIGAALYCMRSGGLDAQGLEVELSAHSGLAGVADGSGDMRELMDARGRDPRAADAISLFVLQARRWLGALVLELGGVDAVAFAGGIGEHMPAIRAEILAKCEAFGIALDPQANARNDARIDSPAARVQVHVIPTDEELAMARIAGAIAGIPGIAPPTYPLEARD